MAVVENDVGAGEAAVEDSLGLLALPGLKGILPVGDVVRPRRAGDEPELDDLRLPVRAEKRLREKIVVVGASSEAQLEHALDERVALVAVSHEPRRARIL